MMGGHNFNDHHVMIIRILKLFLVGTAFTSANERILLRVYLQHTVILTQWKEDPAPGCRALRRIFLIPIRLESFQAEH